jgi:hypothetical protein
VLRIVFSTHPSWLARRAQHDPPQAKVTNEKLERSAGFARLRLVEQAIESIRFQEFKRLNTHISVKVLTVVTHPYAPHARPTRSLDSGDRVFYDNAPVGRNADSGGG